MSAELVKKNVAINKKIGKQTTQVLCEGDIIIPDIKPDVKSILKSTARAYVDEEKSGENRVSFKGRVIANILYEGKNGERAVYAVNTVLPFEDVINMEGVDRNSEIIATAELENIESFIINDRKIGVKAVVNVEVEAYAKENVELVADIISQDNVMTKKENICINNIVERKKDRFSISGQIDLPQTKPEIFQVLQADISIADKEAKAYSGRVGVNGTILLSILYSADGKDSVIELYEQEIPFSEFIEMENVKPDMNVRLDLKVLDQDIKVLPDDDGSSKNIQYDISIGADAIVSENEDISYVDDAYCIDKNMDIKKQEITYPKYVGKNNTQISIRQMVTIDGKYDDVLQIVKVWGSIRIDDIIADEEKVTVSGVIDLEVLYIANNDDSPLNVVPVSVPFEQEIEIYGLNEDMAVEVLAEIESISFSMLSEREVEIRTVLDFEVFVLQEEDGYVVKEVEFNDDGSESFEEIGSVMIYVAQKGDSLWEIAKKYNTTIDDILAVNEIENPDIIYPGQKILILKK